MIKQAIAKLVEGKSLTEEEARQTMAQIMDGQATPAQLGGFLVALRMKGETPEEIAGLARTMRSRALAVRANGDLLDTCGTGGDGSGTYNISTATALVAAAAGLKVAKHGNRSASSKCGSADVLEALGVRIALTPAQAQECLEKIGFAFLFAPAYHPAMKHAASVRGELGIRTVFNILGPLANPAGATRQLLGVAQEGMAPRMAAILQRLGSRHALVVHGADGLDEVSLAGSTRVHEVRDGSIRVYDITPQDLGLPGADQKALAGGEKEENARIIRALFDGEKGAKRDALLANAAAALYAGDRVANLKEGVAVAAATIDSGAARETLRKYVEATQRFAA